MSVEGACQNCGTALPMCLYWKMHGYVACCPECKHGQPPAKVDRAFVPSPIDRGADMPDGVDEP
jgi:hypothetical protein